MKLVSTAFGHQQNIPDKYTCKGANVNPPLQFLEVPEQAKSLVLIVDDPDAPGGTHSAGQGFSHEGSGPSAWVHWVVFNIDPQTLGIEENNKPSYGIEGVTSFGVVHYGGPCPPPASPEQLQRGESGTHRYFFKLYALDTLLDLPETPDKGVVEKAMQGHILDQAELIGLFSK